MSGPAPLPWFRWAMYVALGLAATARLLRARQAGSAKALTWIALALLVATILGEFGVL